MYRKSLADSLASLAWRCHRCGYRMGEWWLRDAVGEDYFRTLIYVDLTSDWNVLLRYGTTKVNDDVMASLGRAGGITRLELDGNPTITDESLRHLRHLRQLREIWMRHANIQGPGLRHLLRSRGLSHLALDYTPLTDEGLRYLGQLPNLNFLRLASATKATVVRT